MGLLVLSRQRDESLIIGDDVEIVVVDIRGDKVRLGVDAPKEVSVHRKEVYDAIRREQRSNGLEIKGSTVEPAKQKARDVAKQLLIQFPKGYAVKADGTVIEFTGNEPEIKLTGEGTYTWTVK